MNSIEHEGGGDRPTPLLGSAASGDAADRLARALLASADRSPVAGDAKARNWRGVRDRLAMPPRWDRRLWPAIAAALGLVATGAIAAPLATKLLAARRPASPEAHPSFKLASRTPPPPVVEAAPATADQQPLDPVEAAPTTPPQAPRATHATEPRRARAELPGEAMAREPVATVAPPTAREPAGDASLVIAAVKALRAEHAPLRAATLARSYLTRHPNGPLAEEALATLALSTADSDARAAATWAAEYVRLYPRGAYRAAVAPLLARPAP